jgi:hypothetical protein
MRSSWLFLLLAVGASGCGSGNGADSFSSNGASSADNCLIPSNQLVNGGPGRDGIPALNRPATVTAGAADQFLAPDALVVGVSLGGQSRAYPHNVLWWHEIVNDELGGRPITVSYCPLTGSGMAYDPVIGGQSLSFGVSGLLFDNNLVLFDRGTESLWSQMRTQGVCGNFAGTPAPLIPVTQSTWEGWRALHPETSVVSFNTGFSRNYNQYPYGTYDQLGDNSLLFPQSFIDARRPMKELVLGINQGGTARAYPYGILGERAAVNDAVGGRAVLVVFDRRTEMAVAFEREVAGRRLSFQAVEAEAFPFHLRDSETGTLWNLTGTAVSGPQAGSRINQLATYSAMWFAWASFNRNTELFEP